MDRIVLFLNGARGEAVLEALIGARHGVTAVVTPTAMPSAGSQRTLEDHGAAHLVRKNVNDAAVIAELASFAPDLFVVAGFSTILTEPVFSLPKLGTINLHAGRLPKYRGGSPLNWQLINGEQEIGTSVLQVDAGIDTGAVLAEAAFPLGDRDTIADLHERANTLFPELVLKCVAGLEDGTLVPRVQDEASAEYWHQRNDLDGHIDFRSSTAVQADRMIRALTRPYRGAWSLYNGTRVRLFAAEFPGISLRGVPGRICYVQGQGPYVVCRDGALLVTNYELEGDSNGRLRHGDRLG
jgi:methionyl-tRNA formyltransferase